MKNEASDKLMMRTINSLTPHHVAIVLGNESQPVDYFQLLDSRTSGTFPGSQ
jgi:hypothetical protein